MKIIYSMAIASGILVLGASAQDVALQTNVDQMKVRLDKLTTEARVLSIGGGVMGPPVKGAPYSADEIRENTQVLADGTTIHNETKTTVYRDGEGRVRRETPNEISIWDPASGTNYVLNPKTMQARQMSLRFAFTRSTNNALAAPGGDKGQTSEFFYSAIKSGEAPLVVMSGDTGFATLSDTVSSTAAPGVIKRSFKLDTGNKESLGTQSMEGVNAEGERITSTIETGAIGNDRPIQTVTERWYSQDLQTNIMTKRSDPRSGEETFKLTNIHKGEPSPVLFEVAARVHHRYQFVGSRAHRKRLGAGVNQQAAPIRAASHQARLRFLSAVSFARGTSGPPRKV